MTEQEKHSPAVETPLMEPACARHGLHPDNSREQGERLEGYSLDTLTALLDD
jgi:hypothetical protein